MENNLNVHRTPLLKDTFAIQQDAIYVPKDGSEIAVNEDGSLTLTLTYELKDKENDLRIGQNEVIDFDVYGVFGNKSKAKLKKGGFPEKLIIFIGSGPKDVFLQSEEFRIFPDGARQQEIHLVTGGNKKEVGNELRSSQTDVEPPTYED